MNDITDVTKNFSLKLRYYALLLSLPYRATLYKTDTSVRRTDFWATKVSLSERVDCMTLKSILSICLSHALVYLL